MIRVKEICKEKNIKLKDLAKAIGTTPSTLSQSLAGRISVERLQKIAQYLDVSMIELFDEIEVTVKIGERVIKFRPEEPIKFK